MTRLTMLMCASVALALSGCAGDTGPAGATGMAGTAGADGMDGMDGMDLTAPAPVDMHFAFATTNNSGGRHFGKPSLLLDFDGTAADGDTVVSSRITGNPPRLDGRDGGLMAEWGGFESDVVFDAGPGGSGITGATLRSVYDDQFIYFFARWTETTAQGNTVGESNHRKMYTYDGSAWSQGGNEDRAYFVFPIDDPGFDTSGCTGGCHLVGMDGWMSAPDGALWDHWHWKAARTAPTHTADDKYLTDESSAADPEAGHHGDEGMSAYWEPGSDTMPAFMPVGAAPGVAAAYPSWVWEAVPFDSSLAWAAGDTLPGTFNRLPTGSRGDVQAVGQFDTATGTWTLELKRARYTGNGDDYQF